MADSLHQVGLADTGLAVDEKRIVGASRRLRDAQRCGVRETVGGADSDNSKVKVVFNGPLPFVNDRFLCRRFAGCACFQIRA